MELSDPQLDSEAEVMAYFKKSQTEPAKYRSSSCPSSCPHKRSLSIHARPTFIIPSFRLTSAENITRKPDEYFCDYFDQETWEEIAGCTVKMSNMSQPVTAREVAQFVGIHIAMGTLKVSALDEPLFFLNGILL